MFNSIKLQSTRRYAVCDRLWVLGLSLTRDAVSLFVHIYLQRRLQDQVYARINSVRETPDWSGIKAVLENYV